VPAASLASHRSAGKAAPASTAAAATVDGRGRAARDGDSTTPAGPPPRPSIVVAGWRLRGGRPYQEDRHVVVRGLTPSHTEPLLGASSAHPQVPTAALSFGAGRLGTSPGGGSGGGFGGGVDAAVGGGETTADDTARPARVYIGLFDGHNGADCSERAVRELHCRLASHPGMARTPPPPPAAVFGPGGGSGGPGGRHAGGRGGRGHGGGMSASLGRAGLSGGPLGGGWSPPPSRVVPLPFETSTPHAGAGGGGAPSASLNASLPARAGSLRAHGFGAAGLGRTFPAGAVGGSPPGAAAAVDGRLDAVETSRRSVAPGLACPRAQALRAAYLDTDKALLRDADAGRVRGGSTALSIVIEGSDVWVAHAGDTRAVLGGTRTPPATAPDEANSAGSSAFASSTPAAGRPSGSAGPRGPGGPGVAGRRVGAAAVGSAADGGRGVDGADADPLSRPPPAPRAWRLTVDHKPDRPSERRRITARGGVVERLGVWRVLAAVPGGDGSVLSGLAVSRSLGDAEFKRPRELVSAEPEVGRLRLRPGDQVIVSATDGLWDVVSDDDAVTHAVRAIRAAMRAQAAAASQGAGLPYGQPGSPGGFTARRGAGGLLNRGARGSAGGLGGPSGAGAGGGGIGGAAPSDPRHPMHPAWCPWRLGLPIPASACHAAARALAERAIAQGSLDNVTVVVAALAWHPEKSSGAAGGLGSNVGANVGG